MDPMKTAPQWGPFLSSYMGQTTPQTTPAMKGMTPTGTMSQREAPGGDNFLYGSSYYEEPMYAEGFPTGENPCRSGYFYHQGRCIWNDEKMPTDYRRQEGAVGPGAGCPPGYQLINGQCMYAP